MELVINIESQSELELLLPLLERLEVSFKYSPELAKKLKKKSSKKSPLQTKNYDDKIVKKLFEKLHNMNAFKQIKNPITWQKQQRDEWVTRQ